MPIQNKHIVETLTRLADLLEIEGANPFRIRAYRTAARTISGLARNVAELLTESDDLTHLTGIGKELDEKIKEIVRTGKLAKLQEIERRLPAGLHQILKIPGLGPRKVKVLYDNLHIENVADLEQCAREGRIRKLDGFGSKTEARILEEIGRLSQIDTRMPWITAESVTRSLVDYLKREKAVADIAVAGSFRRRRETVGDLDILVTGPAAAAIMDRFVAYEDTERIVSRGDTRASIILRSGLQVDLRVVPPKSFGAALHYFTGSQAHNIAVRRIGQQMGLKINEYGVFKGGDLVGGRTEEEVFESVGLPFIPPELREDKGEIQAARRKRLPQLLVLENIRGDLHCHTADSDGRNTLEEMVSAAEARGYEYIAVTNHTQSLRIAGGLEPGSVRRLMARIDRLNESRKKITVLKSMEVDILRDGSLDLPDDVLKELDFTVCSVHSDFRLDRNRQTERILRGMDNPYFTILGHPSGRLLNQRPAYEVDLERLISAAAEKKCFMELNAHPDRLDLNDAYCRLAKETGVRVAVSTDSHSTAHLDYMRLGVAQARRGWLEPQDVLNTLPLHQLMKRLKRT